MPARLGTAPRYDAQALPALPQPPLGPGEEAVTNLCPGCGGYRPWRGRCSCYAVRERQEGTSPHPVVRGEKVTKQKKKKKFQQNETLPFDRQE